MRKERPALGQRNVVGFGGGERGGGGWRDWGVAGEQRGCEGLRLVEVDVASAASFRTHKASLVTGRSYASHGRRDCHE